MDLPFPDAAPNFLALYAQGRQAGQQQRRDTARQNAFSMAAAGNTDGAAQALLGAGDFEGAARLDERASQQRERDFLHGVEPGKVVDPLEAARQFGGDPHIYDMAARMNGQQRAEAAERSARLAAVGVSLMGRPYEERRAAIQAIKPALQGAYGFTPEQLDSFDPTDANLQALVGTAGTVKELLDYHDKQADNARQDAQSKETARHNRATEDETGAYHQQENALSAGRLGLERGRLGIEGGRLSLERQRAAQAGNAPSALVGRLLNKQAAGQALTPGEQQALETYKSTVRSAGLFGDLSGDGGAGGEYGAPPPRAPTAPMPAAAPPPQPPPRALAALKPGQNTTFGNGQVWTVRNGQPVRVK